MLWFRTTSYHTRQRPWQLVEPGAFVSVQIRVESRLNVIFGWDRRIPQALLRKYLRGYILPIARGN